MTTQTTQTIAIQSSSQPPAIIIPDADLFARRADRFDQLADGHSLGDWLRFLAVIARAQHAALQALPDLPLPDGAALACASEHRMPPLSAQSWRQGDTGSTGTFDDEPT